MASLLRPLGCDTQVTELALPLGSTAREAVAWDVIP